MVDPDLLSEAADESLRESKFRMVAGSIMPMNDADGVDDGLFINLESSAANASRIGGVSKEHLAKVWRLNEDEARRMLEVTLSHANETIALRFHVNLAQTTKCCAIKG